MFPPIFVGVLKFIMNLLTSPKNSLSESIQCGYNTAGTTILVKKTLGTISSQKTHIYKDKNYVTPTTFKELGIWWLSNSFICPNFIELKVRCHTGETIHVLNSHIVTGLDNGHGRLKQLKDTLNTVKNNSDIVV